MNLWHHPQLLKYAPQIFILPNNSQNNYVKLNFNQSKCTKRVIRICKGFKRFKRNLEHREPKYFTDKNDDVPIAGADDFFIF